MWNYRIRKIPLSIFAFPTPKKEEEEEEREVLQLKSMGAMPMIITLYPRGFNCRV